MAKTAKKKAKKKKNRIKKVKAVFFEIEPWEKQHIKKYHKYISPVFSKGFLTQKNVHKAKDADVIAVFTYSKVDKKALDNMPNLKLIATMSTGFDHIDLKECRKRGIKISNVPVYGERTVAEYTMAMMLALSRKIIQSAKSVKTKWLFRNKGLRGFDVQHKTLGIIGCGKIGSNVAKLAKGFDMNVFVYDAVKNEKLAKEIGFKYTSLKNLLGKSDIITLNVPLNSHTKYLLNKKNIKYIKKGAYLINTSRGGVVETKAVIKALDKGILAGAALDVIEEEKYLKGRRNLKKSNGRIKIYYNLVNRSNVLVTPHNAFNSREAIERIFFTTLDNIKSFFLKGRCVNEVK